MNHNRKSLYNQCKLSLTHIVYDVRLCCLLVWIFPNRQSIRVYVHMNTFDRWWITPPPTDTHLLFKQYQSANERQLICIICGEALNHLHSAASPGNNTYHECGAGAMTDCAINSEIIRNKNVEHKQKKSTGLFTPSEGGSESKDERINNKHLRRFSLSLDVNEPQPSLL